MKTIKEQQLEQGDVFIPKCGSPYVGYSANHLVETLELARFAIVNLIDEEVDKVLQDYEGTISRGKAEDEAYDTIKDKFEEMGLLEFFERIME